MTNHNKNPFLNEQGIGACDAESRIKVVKRFDRVQCLQALSVQGLQKTVENKIKSHLRVLEKANKAVSSIERGGA